MLCNWRVLATSLITIGFAIGASAADDGAVGNGNWNNAATWTPGGGPPGASDNVFIGSSYPSGSSDNATVTLTQNEAAGSVYLGYTLSGMLDLNGFQLTTTYLTIGSTSSARGTVNHNGGSLNTQELGVFNGHNLLLTAADVAGIFHLVNGSTANTASAGNLTNSAYLFNGSTLTLGADLNLTGALDLRVRHAEPRRTTTWRPATSISAGTTIPPC